MESLNLSRGRLATWMLILAVGAIAGSALTSRPDAAAPTWMPSVAAATVDLGEGEFSFLPSRRTVWVVNRTNGRMAAYTFLNNEYSTVQRSRVAQIDLNAFPAEHSSITLSDRNLNQILWICNSRTGDVEMWQLTRDSELRKSGPIATSADLSVRR